MTDRSHYFLEGLSFVDFLLATCLEGAATFRPRNEILNLGAENDGAARHIDSRQSAPADQINNGLLRYASDSCGFGLRNPISRFHRLLVSSG